MRRFFDRIAFLLLSDAKKHWVAEKVITDLNTGRLYRAEFILSIIIATLGLLLNSTAVVIGAMLIAPILRPIQAISFAISTGNKGMYVSAMKLLLGSICLGVAFACVITWFVGIERTTSEIMARTSPTVLELLIAAASGVVAILSLGFKRLSESIAGVAMAASLIPPLGVAGIGLAWGQLTIAQGSMLLFLANLIAIVVVGVVIFYAFGFYPTNKKGQSISAQYILVVIGSMVVLLIPLLSGFNRLLQDSRINDGIQQVFQQELASISPQAELEYYEYRLSDGGDTVDITARINVPSHIYIDQQDKTIWLQNIAEAIAMPASLSLQIVPLSPVVRPSSPVMQEQILRDAVREVFALSQESTLLDLSIQVREGSQDQYIVYSRYYVQTDDISMKDRTSAWEESLQEKFADSDISYLFLWDEVVSSPQTDQRYMRILQDREKYMTNVGTYDHIHMTQDEEGIYIEMIIRSHYDRGLRNKILQAWKNKLETDWQSRVRFDVSLDSYERKVIE